MDMPDERSAATPGTNDRPAPAAGPAGSLVEHFTRFIAVMAVAPGTIPDQLDRLEALQVATPDGGSRPLWLPLDEATQASQVRFLLPWVRDYLMGVVPDGSLRRDRDCIARRWNPDAAADIRGKLTWDADGASLFSLDGCEVYLFSTGIAVAVLECSILTRQGLAPNLNDLVDFNYVLQRLEPHRVPAIRVAGWRSRPPGQAAPQFLPGLASAAGMTLEGILRQTLAPLFATPGTEILDRRAFKVQTFARVGPGERLDDLGQTFYQLRRVVGPSYPAAPADLALEGRADTVRTFENVVVGFSLEGFAVLLVDTGHPFYAEFANRVRCSYFAHYLVALHQRSALLVLALEAGRLPRITPGRFEADERLHRLLRDLRLRAIDFNLHHRFSQVSTMTHYAQVYEGLTDALAIPSLLDEVRDEIGELDEILRLHRERSEQEQRDSDARERDRAERAEADRDRRLNQTIAVLGPLSLLLSLYGTNLPDYSQVRTYLSPAFWLPLCAWLLLTVLLWRLARRKPGGG